jgi:hypothetical protein
MMGINDCCFHFVLPAFLNQDFLVSHSLLGLTSALRVPLFPVFLQVPLTMIMSVLWPILILMLCSSASTLAGQKHWTVSSRRWESWEAGQLD